jgi:hypothetical protein
VTWLIAPCVPLFERHASCRYTSGSALRNVPCDQGTGALVMPVVAS